MQELLEEVINAREIAMGIDFRSALDFVRDAIEQDYLEKEKESLSTAFHTDRPSLSIYENGSAFEEWYNETFNTEEK